MKTYIDTLIPSTYLARPPARYDEQLRHHAVRALVAEAERRGIRFTASSFIKEECREGNAGQARARLNFLRGVTIFDETDRIRKLARRLVEAMDEPGVIGDARHYAAAMDKKIPILITWDQSFTRIAAVAKSMRLDHRPEIILPVDAAFRIGTAVLPNPFIGTLLERLNEPSPFIRRLIREKNARQRAVLKREAANGIR
jgi:hypothetical protein